MSEPSESPRRGRKSKLTPEVHALVVERIRDGAYDWVAAQAAGIDPTTFCRWMKWGEKGQGGPEFRQFCQEVRQAHAEARAGAEAEVRKTDPFKWLRYGPGRERPGAPGWTDSQAVDLTSGGKAIPFKEMVIHPPEGGLEDAGDGDHCTADEDEPGSRDEDEQGPPTE
jgi:hypothetical protein